MLSSSPAIPIKSINFADSQQRRLSLVTGHGRELLTAHDALPSPEHLTPISGTPFWHSPAGSEAGSAPISRRGSESGVGDDGTELRKATSRGRPWSAEVSGANRLSLVSSALRLWTFSSLASAISSSRESRTLGTKSSKHASCQSRFPSVVVESLQSMMIDPLLGYVIPTAMSTLDCLLLCVK